MFPVRNISVVTWKNKHEWERQAKRLFKSCTQHCLCSHYHLLRLRLNLSVKQKSSKTEYRKKNRTKPKLKGKETAFEMAAVK